MKSSRSEPSFDDENGVPGGTSSRLATLTRCRERPVSKPTSVARVSRPSCIVCAEVTATAPSGFCAARKKAVPEPITSLPDWKRGRTTAGSSAFAALATQRRNDAAIKRRVLFMARPG